MAVPVSNLTLTTSPDPLVAGVNSTITCAIDGGNPAPNITFEASDGVFKEVNVTKSVSGSVAYRIIEATPALSGMIIFFARQ